MHDIHRILLSSEVRDLTDEVSRLFEDLDRTLGASRRTPVGHCTPVLDVQDMPGVTPEGVRVLIKNATLIVAGEKPWPYPDGRGDATFHLVERSFGRFARAVTLEGAVDAGRARAVLSGGELRVSIPRLDERRGKEILVPVAAA
jgi:HSP20 family protein